jgi:DNA-binding MarR family transcriptional regulator
MNKEHQLFASLIAAGKMNMLCLKIMLINKIAQQPIQVHEIALELQVTAPAVSRSLDLLEKKGMIKRQRDEIDRRRVFISLTAKGETFIKNVVGR